MAILSTAATRWRAYRALSAVAVLLASSVAVTVQAAPADAAPAGGSFVTTTPTRVLDTRTGAYGNRKGAVGAHGVIGVTITGTSGVPSTASAVAVTISVVGATSGGAITASTYGVASRPNVTNVQFAAHGTATDLAVVHPTSGRIDLWNASSGSVQLVMDVVGYYAGGTASSDGALHVMTPRRVVDTRSGLQGFHHGALAGHGVLSANLDSLASLPTDAGAVAATVTVYSPARSGSLVAYATGTTRPAEPLLTFTAGNAVSQYAVLPVSDIQGLSLYNASTGSLQITIDVLGFQTNGPASAAGGQQVVAANRIFSDSTVPARASDSVAVLGHGGVPRSGVRAVTVAVRVSGPAAAGTVVGSSHAAPTITSFAAHRTVMGAAVLPVVSGKVTLRNTSVGSLALTVDVVGYVPSTSITPPSATNTVARYPNDLTPNVANDQTTMHTHGTADAAKTFALLDLGAQTISAPLSATNRGIALTLTSPTVRLSFHDLTSIIERYIDGLATGNHAVTLAVATNNDGDWTHYSAATRAHDFALFIRSLATYGVAGGRHVTVYAAADIESTFASTEAQAQAWEDHYFSANSHDQLVYAGALVGCPTVFGSAAACAFGWTQQQYWNLSHHLVGGVNHVQVLPQIYFPVQAVQWANVYAVGGGGLRFAGSLTEHGADSSTYLPAQGWAALVRALQWRTATPSVARMVDISPDA